MIDFGHNRCRLVTDGLWKAEVLVSSKSSLSAEMFLNTSFEAGLSYWTGGTSRMQWPKLPNVTEELRISVLLVSITLRMAISPMIGEEIVVIKRRMAAMNKRATPTLFTLCQSRPGKAGNAGDERVKYSRHFEWNIAMVGTSCLQSDEYFL